MPARPLPLAALLAATAALATACTPPAPPPPDVLADAMDPGDATADASGPPPIPPSDPLPPVRVDDLELRARTNGAFELAAGGRVLLASRWGPIAAQRYDERVTTLLGQWAFRRSNASEVRPGANGTATVEGTDLVLRLAEREHTAELRFHRRSPDEVEIRAEVHGPSPHKSTALRFRCDPDAHFLGFGEQYNFVDHRGRSFALFVSEQGLGRDPARPSAVSGSPETTYYPLPFFFDPRGFGLVAETDARVLVDLCHEVPDEYLLAPEQPEALTVRLYTGPTVSDVMRAWTLFHGRTAPAPDWAVDGTWLGVQGGPDALRAYLRSALDARVPVGVIWAQDWVGRKDLGLGDIDIRYHWTADDVWYPNLAALVSEFRAQGVRFLGYFNPFVLEDEDQFAEGRAQGLLALHADGSVYTWALPHGSATMVDLGVAGGAAWFQGYARRAVDLGFSGWMQDYGEWFPVDAALSGGRDSRRYHNRYPVEWHAAARAVLEERYPAGDWVMFSRSGWLGDARHAQVVWAGDQEASFGEWDGLPTVVPALVSLGMSGVGYVTHDIGGYFGGPSTRELYLRWIELGAFTPVMRTHEGLRRDENWSWNRDAETLAFFSRFARIHQLLGPMIRAASDVHQRTGMPIVRALPLVFPDDARTYALTDEYLLGDELLVAPVVHAGETARRVYFPRGQWHSVWDPALVVDGPTEREVPAPLGSPPVFSLTPRSDLAAVR